MNKEGQIRVLVLVTDYPGIKRKEAHRFVHVRNLVYKNDGIDVTVLNFATKEDYKYEGIRVISLQTYKTDKDKYDLLISHQPNIRQHYRFMRQYGKRFVGFIFFFHGHEVLRFSKTYPKPYSYVGDFQPNRILRDLYDIYKLSVWRRYIPKIIHKSTLFFVSRWMYNEFLNATRLAPTALKGRYRITYNCVGEPFEKKTYDVNSEKLFDFVTIRSNLDGSKYAIDIVNELARNNPEAKFLVIGRGKFFDYNLRPDNLIWENRTLNHQEVLEALNTARCALMPTRTDAQGLMACEMATYGMPLITSELPVCHEVFDSFCNVQMINNESLDIKLLPICELLEKGLPYKKNDIFFNENTSAYEVEAIKCFFDET